MKLKQATLLAIIGVCILLIPPFLEVLMRWEILRDQYFYFKISSYLRLFGTIFLLPYFIILFKKQK